MKAWMLVMILVLSPVLALAEKLDINTATAEQLDEVMRGVGPNKAAAIVRYRELNGPYKSIYQIAKIKGIAKRTVLINEDVIEVR